VKQCLSDLLATVLARYNPHQQDFSNQVYDTPGATAVSEMPESSRFSKAGPGTPLRVSEASGGTIIYIPDKSIAEADEVRRLQQHLTTNID
jgi:hypothetical protein